jgi:Cu2+-exporting ATPase
MPETALRLDAQGQAVRVSVQRLVPGDLVRVPVGEAFAADAQLVEGGTWADESLLTGESVAIEIARSAVGGIALALSVPLTTAIAAVLATPNSAGVGPADIGRSPT